MYICIYIYIYIYILCVCVYIYIIYVCIYYTKKYIIHTHYTAPIVRRGAHQVTSRCRRRRFPRGKKKKEVPARLKKSEVRVKETNRICRALPARVCYIREACANSPTNLVVGSLVINQIRFSSACSPLPTHTYAHAYAHASQGYAFLPP